MLVSRPQWIPHDNLIVVAVSGGADSLALLHWLKSFHHYLHVATFDHGLRGEESRADAEFVRELAESWGLPVTVGHGNLDPDSPNLEARAREARYRFLAEVARSANSSYIATAHHADDQAETVLLHLLRGSSIHGLAGMRSQSPVPYAPALTLIRPLLNVSRVEIEAYCREQGLMPRHDATNDDTAYLRNKIRRELIPYLREFNPQIVENLNRLAESAEVEDEYLNDLMFERTKVAIQQPRVVVALDVFRNLHPALQRRCVYHMITQIGGDVSYHHILQVVEVGARGGTGANALLPGKLRARVDYDELVIEPVDAPPGTSTFVLPSGAEYAVNVPGETRLPGWTLTFHEQPLSQPHVLIQVPFEATVILRTRREGDRFAPPGLKGHRQKLKKWLIDHKIPVNIRDLLPLLIINNEVAGFLHMEQWIISENFKHSEKVVISEGKNMAVTVAKIEESSYS